MIFTHQQFLAYFYTLPKYFIRLIVFIIFAIFILTPLPTRAFGENKTNSINIEVNQKNAQLLNINYTITQTFASESRGIFLALPKNQNGAWTEYQITSVQRSDVVYNDLNALTNNNTKKDESATVFSPEPYDTISEWNAMRLRVGKPDRILALGTYTYKISIQAQTNIAAAHNFTLIDNWTDPIGKLLIIDEITSKPLCTIQLNQSCNSAGNISINRNSSLPKPAWYNLIIDE